ncbi:citrate synthase family protein [Solirhodobacter olei]|uniref:citrate synthase family protein n=1 Tax=Solirhodobacter olei TaxID=2493082 RepID=UPI000FDB64CD|nr:citrate synthase family protein [Solirhodobacter olei]
MTNPTTFLDAETAAEVLGVSRATLYAYVSRGFVRAVPGADDPRRRLYSAEDIATLGKRKKAGRRPRDVASATLDWGLPVLSSAITLIEAGQFYYRGRNAVEWAEQATLEETARLLWGCGETDPFGSGEAPGTTTWDAALLAASTELPLSERCQMLLPLVAAGRATAWQREGRRLWSGAAELLRAMTAAATASIPSAKPIHARLAHLWGVDGESADLLRQSLVLVADHELNASAFAVRVVASTGASLGACLNAGLSALGGPLHGGTTSLVEALMDEVAAPAEVLPVIETRFRRGDGVPGFGHPLYPEGDPRARVLLDHLPPNATRAVLVDTMQESTGRYPNLDFALVAVRRALGLPKGAALALFTIGRTAGWIAHALEQYSNAGLIRPRAHYTGPVPGAEDRAPIE